MAGVRAFLGVDIHRFQLDGPGVAELEAAHNSGLGALLERAVLSTMTTREIMHAFKLGLTGAGLDERAALDLTAAYVGPGRYDWARQIVQLVLDEAWSAFEMAEEEVLPGVLGKPEPLEAADSSSSETAASTSPPSGADSPKKGLASGTSGPSPLSN